MVNRPVNKRIQICRTLLKQLQKGQHQTLPPGVLRRIHKLENILNKDGDNITIMTVMNMIEVLGSILRALGGSL